MRRGVVNGQDVLKRSQGRTKMASTLILQWKVQENKKGRTLKTLGIRRKERNTLLSLRRIWDFLHFLLRSAKWWKSTWWWVMPLNHARLPNATATTKRWWFAMAASRTSFNSIPPSFRSALSRNPCAISRSNPAQPRFARSNWNLKLLRTVSQNGCATWSWA